MCLLIDDREDPRVPKAFGPYDVAVEVTRLEYGDFSFVGNGDRGGVVVGIERKRLGDLVASMLDRRLAGRQVRGMSNAYDYLGIIVEGLWRPTSDGGIETWEGQWRPLFHQRQGVSYRQVAAYLASLTYKANVVVHRSSGIPETAALVAAEYHWWQKPWSEHHTSDAIYADGPSKRNRGSRRGRAVETGPEPGIVEKVAAQFPHLDRRAWQVGAYFPTVRAMLNATEDEWRQCLDIAKGRKIIGDVMRTPDMTREQYFDLLRSLG